MGYANIVVYATNPLEITLFTGLGNSMDADEYEKINVDFIASLERNSGKKFVPTGPPIHVLSIALDSEWLATREAFKPVKTKAKLKPDQVPGQPDIVPNIAAVLGWADVAFSGSSN